MSITTRAILAIAVAVGLPANGQSTDITYKFKILSDRPDEILRDEVAVALKKASVVSMRLRDPVRAHAFRDTIEQIDFSRHYEVKANCMLGCDNVFPEIMKRVRSARHIDGPCPDGFTVAMKFVDKRGATILSGYVSMRGQCLLVNAKHYILTAENSIETPLVSAMFK